MKSARDAGCPKIAIGITGSRENLVRYDGIEVPYWGPSLTEFRHSVEIEKGRARSPFSDHLDFEIKFINPDSV